MSTMELTELTIDDRAYNYAKIYSSLLNDEYQRKRSYASLVALYAFLNLLETTPYNIQKSMTLFRNPQVNEQYEISDLYVNNWHLDVRVMTDGDSFLVPKVHYENNIVPDFYIVVRINKELTKAELVGIADTSEDKHEAFDYNYHSIPTSSLITYDEFLNRVQKEKAEKFTEEDHKIFEEAYLGFMDNNLGMQSKAMFIKHLFECSECRTEFCCFTGFEMVSCNASKYPDLFNDQTLGIVGAQNVYDKKYEGKEETIYIGNEQQSLIEDETENDTDDFLNDLSQNENNDTNDTDSVLDEIVEASNDNEIVEDTLDEITNLPEANNIIEEVPEEPKINEEKEQTVSDILNELFDEEEGYIDSTTDSEKTVATQLQEQSIEENNILEEDIIDDASVIDFNENQDLNVIKDNNIEDTIGTYDIIDNITTENEETLKEEPLVLINDDDSSAIIPIDETNNGEVSAVEEIGTETQKVIVDYDEFGEPIYSYITNIEDENTTDDILEEMPSEPAEENDIETVEQNVPDVPFDEDIEASIEDTLEELTNSDEVSNLVEEKSDINNNVKEEAENDDNTFYDDDEEDNNAEDTEEGLAMPEDKNNEKEEAISSEEDVEEETSEEDEEFEEYDEEDEDSEEDDDDEEYEYDENGDDVPPEGQVKSNGKLIGIIAAIIVLLGLAGGGTWFFMNKNKTETPPPPQNIGQNQNQNQEEQQPRDIVEESNENNQENPPEENFNEQEQVNQEQQNNEENPAPADEGQLSEGDLIPPQAERPENPEGNINKAIVNSFNQNRSSVSLRELNWFCTTELFSDKVFKKYLQNIDNNLKQNLRNNFMNSVDTPPNDTVAAKFAIDNNGNLQKVIISNSSGSEEIDNIVLQSIKETFEGEKSPILNEGSLKSDMYFLKVVIKI